MYLAHDLRFAARSLRRTPGLLAVAVLSLGVGIAAVTTIWAGVDTLFLRSLPYDPNDELVFIGTAEDGRGGASSNSALADFLDLRDDVGAVRLAAYRSGGVNLAGDPAEWIAARHVSGDFFDVLEVRPQLGRLFSRGDEEAGAPATAVLSHGLWQRRFGGDPAVLGRTLLVDGSVVSVVGVLRPGFEFGFDPPEIWLPLRLTGAEQRGVRAISMVGRVRPGGMEATRQQLDALAAGLAEAYPSTNGSRSFRVNGVRDEWFSGATFRQGAAAALVAATLVLLIACANVANLLLARGAGRADEMALRQALGARRSRLLRQLLTEAGVLAVAAGIAGLLLAVVGIRGLLTLVPAGMPRTGEIGFDPRVLAAGMVVAVGSVLLFGLLPSIRAIARSPGRLSTARTDGVRMGRSRLRGMLVGAEIALAVVLLATTALVLRSVTAIRNVDTGLRTQGVMAFTLNLPESRYPDDATLSHVVERVQEELAAVPGVGSVGVGVGVPARRWRSVSYRLAEDAAGDDARSVFTRFATPGYLFTLGVSVTRGRGLNAADGAATGRVALVNERFARTHWPAAEPIGRVLQVGGEAVEVVGVVPDVHEYGPTLPPQPGIYLPLAQWPARQLDVVLDGADASTLLADIREAVARVDPGLGVHGADTLERILMGPAEQFTALGKLLAVLGAAALLLAVVGVYGSMAYAVARRVPEIGVRMALGAEPATIRGMVLRDASTITVTGLVIGLLLALGAARGISAFLFGVRTSDPLIFAVVGALLLGVSLAAAWLPARRASRVDPLDALRSP